jgi:glycosyltransferase involved in cell wall biosynthesis
MLKFHRIIKTWDAKVDRYIALTDFAKTLYSSAGLPEEKIVVKPNFVPDYIKYRKNPESFGVFIGRLGTEKGVDTLLSALGIADQISFKIIGDGPERNKLEQRAADLKLNGTKFYGHKKREETLSILGRAAFLVLPSICYEGFSMVILEALSMGVPVITTDLGGAPEIIRNDENGFIVPPKDVEILSEKMLDLINDKKLCQNLGLNARKDYEERYTPQRNFDMLMAIYKKTIAAQ